METDDLTPAPRGAWWLRLALLPIAAVLATVLVLGGDRAAGAPVRTEYGATTQGRAFELGVDAEGRPAAFDTSITALCPTGRLISMPWNPIDGDGVRFRRDGGRLRVAERDRLWELELAGRADGAGNVRGTMSLVVHIFPKTGAPYDCASRNVRFFAGG